jgi:hypothetical protein
MVTDVAVSNLLGRFWTVLGNDGSIFKLNRDGSLLEDSEYKVKYDPQAGGEVGVPHVPRDKAWFAITFTSGPVDADGQFALTPQGAADEGDTRLQLCPADEAHLNLPWVSLASSVTAGCHACTLSAGSES